jgi:hypothetical protein
MVNSGTSRSAPMVSLLPKEEEGSGIVYNRTRWYRRRKDKTTANRGQLSETIKERLKKTINERIKHVSSYVYMRYVPDASMASRRSHLEARVKILMISCTL